MRSEYRQLTTLIFGLTVILQAFCYEKTLRKMVRDKTKMVQRPFSDNTRVIGGDTSYDVESYNIRSGPGKKKSSVQKYLHPLSTRLTLDTIHPKLNMKFNKSNELSDMRLSRDAKLNVTNPNIRGQNILMTKIQIYEKDNMEQDKYAKEIYYKIPQSRFFPNNYGEMPYNSNEHAGGAEITSDTPLIEMNKSSIIKPITKQKDKKKQMTVNEQQIQLVSDESMEKADFLIEEIDPNITLFVPGNNIGNFDCSPLVEVEAEINAQELYSRLDIEPSWVKNKKYWNRLYDSRYESLMRSSKWPALKVILIPRTQVDTIWKQPFEDLHNNTVRNIISNIVKKLQFYKNLTFTWNEVSHFSKWWETTSKKNRAVVRRLIKQERFEITTGGWVETDESTSHIFGLLHQFMEGHQWLKNNLNYLPEVAWLTNSVTHSPTIPYILSSSGTTNLVMTNIHFSIEQYMAEYQYSDFLWIQNWEKNEKPNTKLNYVLNKMGNDRYPEHTVATHYLQFNSDGFEACGPISEICQNGFDFENSNKNIDVNTYNVKAKSELLLEQYSKTGTLSPHNVIIAPLGGAYHYQKQQAFDYQYNNYWKIADFVNFNQDIYKATLQFGTPKDYFASITNIHKKYPTLKGDFNNYADIKSGAPAYWTGFFTTRPSLKLLLRYLQSNLRSAEIIVSFAHSYSVFATYNTRDLIKRLLNVREIVARLQDRHVVGGTLTARVVRYVYTQILSTIKDCWYIQEVAASFLSCKPGSNKVYLEKYIYRDGDFFSFYKSIISGDQIYIFNSLSQERSDVVELTTRSPNIRILDHNNKDVAIQINPVWQYTSDNMIRISRQFFKIIFIVNLPPLSFALFKVKDTSDITHTVSAIYCAACSVESNQSESVIPFDINPMDRGDVQVENYKFRLTIDEATGFLKKVTDKMTGAEKVLVISYGAFRSSYKNSGMFLFSTNQSRPLYDILLPYRLGTKTKIMIIISGQIVTEVTTIFGKLLQHTVKIYNIIDSPLKNILKMESRVDYEVSPKHREMEMFLSLQTDIANGDTPEVCVDNNGFQYTSHLVNISRRSEAKLYPMTSTAFIQDKLSRLTVITDHTQGVTALQEGQLVVMLDRRVLYNDNRGTAEGIADNCAMTHRHILLLESLERVATDDGTLSHRTIQLPSPYANYFANVMNYPLDVFFISKNMTNFCYYMFLPLVKSSFPCDVNVINFRMAVNKGYKMSYTPNTALATMHRQSFSCRTQLVDSINCKEDSRFNMYKIFHNVREVYKTNLLGTHQGVPIKMFDLTNFKPMELMTLRLYF